MLVEGVRAVGAALDGGARPRFAVVSERLEDRPGGALLLRRLDDLGVDVRGVSDAELAELADTETPQGVLLVVEERDVPLGALVPGRWLVLDGVQDPGNAGTLVRAAVAFGLDGVVALDGTVDLWSPKAVRASAGLTFRVPVARASVDAVLEHCAREGVAFISTRRSSIALNYEPISGTESPHDGFERDRHGSCCWPPARSHHDR